MTILGAKNDVIPDALFCMNRKHNKKLGVIRYADDFVITAKSRKEIEEIIPKIKQWLSKRGLEFSKEKTKWVL